MLDANFNKFCGPVTMSLPVWHLVKPPNAWSVSLLMRDWCRRDALSIPWCLLQSVRPILQRARPPDCAFYRWPVETLCISDLLLYTVEVLYSGRSVNRILNFLAKLLPKSSYRQCMGLTMSITFADESCIASFPVSSTMSLPSMPLWLGTKSKRKRLFLATFTTAALLPKTLLADMRKEVIAPIGCLSGCELWSYQLTL